MGISEVMHFERSLFQKMKGYSQLGEGWNYVCVHASCRCNVDCHGTAIEASREARGEDTFPVFYTSYIKGKCQSHSLGKCPFQAKTS